VRTSYINTTGPPGVRQKSQMISKSCIIKAPPETIGFLPKYSRKLYSVYGRSRSKSMQYQMVDFYGNQLCRAKSIMRSMHYRLIYYRIYNCNPQITNTDAQAIHRTSICQYTHPANKPLSNSVRYGKWLPAKFARFAGSNNCSICWTT